MKTAVGCAMKEFFLVPGARRGLLEGFFSPNGGLFSADLATPPRSMLTLRAGSEGTFSSLPGELSIVVFFSVPEVFDDKPSSRRAIDAVFSRPGGSPAGRAGSFASAWRVPPYGVVLRSVLYQPSWWQIWAPRAWQQPWQVIDRLLAG